MNMESSESSTHAGDGVAKLLYKRTPFREDGNIKYLIKALEMPTVEFFSKITDNGWVVTMDVRGNGVKRLVIIRRHPREPGNIYEEEEVWEGGKPLPPEALL